MLTFELDLNIREQSPVSGLIVLQWQCPFFKSSREKKVRLASELEQGRSSLRNEIPCMKGHCLPQVHYILPSVLQRNYS